MQEKHLEIVRALEGRSNFDRRRAAESILKSRGLPYSRIEYSGGGIVNFLVDFGGLEDSEILVSCHFDAAGGGSVPGAADNASSVAVAVNLARALADRPYRRSVTVALFDEEEAGLLGASRHISDFPGSGIYDLNLEWVGDEDNVILWPSQEGRLEGPFAVLREVVLERGGSFACLPYPIIPTDADVYREGGRKAATISTLKRRDFDMLKDLHKRASGKAYFEEIWKLMGASDFGSRYHSQNDTSDHLSEETMRFVTEALLETLDRFEDRGRIGRE